MEDDPIIAHLNTLLELDREAMTVLVSTKVPCNERLARHLFGGTEFEGEEPRVGLLSILNGMNPGPILLMLREGSGIGGEFRRFSASTERLPLRQAVRPVDLANVTPPLPPSPPKAGRPRNHTEARALALETGHFVYHMNETTGVAERGILWGPDGEVAIPDVRHDQFGGLPGDFCEAVERANAALDERTENWCFLLKFAQAENQELRARLGEAAAGGFSYGPGTEGA